MADNRAIYGGQAVLEGVMMRGVRHMATAVRLPDGRIAVWEQPLDPARWAVRVRRVPFLRGVLALWETLVLGVRSLVFSAQVAMRYDPELQAEGDARPSAGSLRGLLWGTVALSLALSVGLFFLLPLGLASVLARWIDTGWAIHAVEGTLRLGILLGYLAAIGRTPDIARVFGYHGAEHKTIHAWERGCPLTIEGARPHSVLHPRCGTGFLLVVVALSVIVFAFLGWPSLVWRIVSRVALIPVIAALAYEFIRLAARWYRHRPVRALLWPSLALQRLTTREPDDTMLETAVVALHRVLVAEGHPIPAPAVGSPVIAVDDTGRERLAATPVGREAEG
ncbi:MAG: DUF1385 domain-containing protein [Thermomicrobium sp.]|nr:DUF1385 domain-containing protein [Thermomicrobium sp.]MDW8060098.1 DUF1385 domain-containing protein [Thermomicrobium sp.]